VVGDQDKDMARSILVALGDGGTYDMAYRIIEWMDGGAELTGIPIHRIGGLSEVAELLGQRKQNVCNWLARGMYGCPEPFRALAATKLYDLDQWRVWAAGHPELVRSSDSGS
jgi:hypothetical protein